MGVYWKLSEHLQAQRARVLSMTFADVEHVLGRRLPPSALRYSAWWANNARGHSHSRAWLEAGWRTEQVDIDGKRLVFRQEQTRGAATGTPFGALRGTVLVARDIASPTGEAWLAEQGKL